MTVHPKLKIILSVLLALLPARAAAYVYFTEDTLMQSFFSVDVVSEVVWAPSTAARDSFKAKVGYYPPVKSYTWHVAREGDAVTGYALVDEQLGQHEPITFGVMLRPDTSIERIEVMVYREQYGDGVRAEGFLAQFPGLDFKNPMRAGKEIRIVSGATISTRSLATGARRASALLATWLEGV